MDRRWNARIGVVVAALVAVLALPGTVAGAAGLKITVKVSPNHGLVGGQAGMELRRRTL